jgi:CDP-diacylglycerol---glycerol-3-phosphate 3-phosphatidyltransferase
MNLLAINPIWITLGPIVVINSVLFTSYLIYMIWVRRRLNHQYEAARRHVSSILAAPTKEWWLWTTDPIVKLCIKLRIGPNAITMIGFLVSCLAGVLFAKGMWGYAGWAMIAGGTCDIFDGRVARMTNRVSRSGAFFDAVMDRFGEGAALLGLAFYFRDSLMLPVVIAALVGSQLVSYTRARGEGVGIDCKIGTMQRPERIVYLGVSSVFCPIADAILVNWWAAPPPILAMLAIGFIALMTNVTAVQRMIFIMNALDTADRREKESIPQLITRLATPAGRERMWERARYGYDRSRAAYSHVLLFLASGMDPEFVRERLARGDMPNVAKHLSERSGAAPIIGAFPSTMGPAATPFVTGCFPGTCDIPGARWFDRTIQPGRVLSMNRFRDYLGWGAYAMDHDLSKSVRTIFEYSRQAVNIFGMPSRGCGLVRDPAFFRTHRSFNAAVSPAEIAKADAAAFTWFSQAVRRETDFVLYRFPPIASEEGGKRSEELAIEACRRIDAAIGRSIELLASLGIKEETAIFLSWDYGAGRAQRSLDLESFLDRRYRLCRTERRIGEWQEAEAIVMPSGTSMAHLFLRGGSDWSERAFFEEVEARGLVGALLEQEEVDLIAGRSVEGGIAVQSRRGRAHLLEDADGRITYLVKGGDPFGLPALPQVFSSAQALALTAESDHPDGIVQLAQLFRSRRTGDIVLSTHDDVVLAGGGIARGVPTHGALARRHLEVPLFSNVALPAGPMRTADVFALTLTLLGIEPEHALDGTAPAESMREKAEAAL